MQGLVTGLLFVQRRLQWHKQGIDAGTIVRKRLLGRCGMQFEQTYLQLQQLPLALVLAGKIDIKTSQCLKQPRLYMLALFLTLQTAAVEGTLHLPDTPAKTPLFIAVAGRIGFE